MQCPSCHQELPANNTNLICLHCGTLIKQNLSSPEHATTHTANFTAPASSAKSPNTLSGNLTRKSILLVEDDPYINQLYSTFLENEGYQVLSAFDAQQADELLKKNSFDLVLLDIMLPDRSGLDILQDLRNDPATATLPVLILSNIEEPDVVEQATALGANKYLVKARTSIHDLFKEANAFLHQVETTL